MARKKRRLSGVGMKDVAEAAEAFERHCPAKFKTKQFVSTCKGTADKFRELISKNGTTPQGIRDAANATDAYCEKNYKTAQYASVCKRVVGGMIREIAKRKPGLEGLKRRRK